MSCIDSHISPPDFENSFFCEYQGLYPLVAWKVGQELVYMVEGASNDTGTLIEWTKSLGTIV